MLRIPLCTTRFSFTVFINLVHHCVFRIESVFSNSSESSSLRNYSETLRKSWEPGIPVNLSSAAIFLQHRKKRQCTLSLWINFSKTQTTAQSPLLRKSVDSMLKLNFSRGENHNSLEESVISNVYPDIYRVLGLRSSSLIGCCEDWH